MANARDTRTSHLTDEELEAELARRRGTKLSGGLRAAELAAETRAAKQSVSELQAYLDQRTDVQPRRAACPKCRKPVGVRARNRCRDVRTTAGEVRLLRNYHFCAPCTFGFYPLDDELGLVEGSDLSPVMEARVLDFAIDEPFARSARRWKKHHAGTISENLARGAIERAGHALASKTPSERAACLKEGEALATARDVVVIETDGSMLSTRESGWKEAKLAVVFRPPADAKKRRARATYVGSMRGIDDFREQLRAHVQHELRTPHGPVVWVGDGAAWNWSLASELCPDATQILDWYHAVSHAHDVTNVLFGEADITGKLFLKRIKDLLARGDIFRLQNELFECQCAQSGAAMLALENLRSYYRTNANRMQYARFRALGFPIGSGAIESAHRHVLQTRMKLAGQHWSLSKAHRLVMLRAAYKSANDNEFLELVNLAA